MAPAGLPGVFSSSHLLRARDGALQGLWRELETIDLRAWHRHRRTVIDQHHVGIGNPIRRGDNDLVARLHGGRQRGMDQLLGAGADDQLVEPEVQPILALELEADGLQQGPRPHRSRIADVAAAQRSMPARTMCAGVGRSGSPTVKSTMSRPCARSWSTRALAAMLGEGLMARARSARNAWLALMPAPSRQTRPASSSARAGRRRSRP